MGARQKTASRVAEQDAFTATYKRDSEGFYVRRQPPAKSTLTDKQIADNLRSLLSETKEPKESEVAAGA